MDVYKEEEFPPLNNGILPYGINIGMKEIIELEEEYELANNFE